MNNSYRWEYRPGEPVALKVTTSLLPKTEVVWLEAQEELPAFGWLGGTPSDRVRATARRARSAA